MLWVEAGLAQPANAPIFQIASSCLPTVPVRHAILGPLLMYRLPIRGGGGGGWCWKPAPVCESGCSDLCLLRYSRLAASGQGRGGATRAHFFSAPLHELIIVPVSASQCHRRVPWWTIGALLLGLWRSGTYPFTPFAQSKGAILHGHVSNALP